jgi:hypothetical protein
LNGSKQQTSQIFAGAVKHAPDDPSYEPGMGGALLCWPADFSNPAGDWVQMRVDDYLKQYPYQNGYWTGPWVDQLNYKKSDNIIELTSPIVPEPEKRELMVAEMA